MTLVRRGLARTTVAVTAVTATLTTLGSPAGANAPAGTWTDGDWVGDTIVNCITGQPSPGYTGRVSFHSPGDQLPEVGETFYVRMEIGLPSLPCTNSPAVLPEVVIPAGLRYADDAKHPVRWAVHTTEGSSGFSTRNLVYDRGVHGGVLIGLRSAKYPDGGPIEVRRGQDLEIRVPVRATKVMKGMATRQPQCDERLEGTAPCPVSQSGDHLQVAFTKTDTGPMQHVIPFVGLLVQKAKATLSARAQASPVRAGRITVRVGSGVVPTGVVRVSSGQRRLAVGTLAQRHRCRGCGPARTASRRATPAPAQWRR